jgi:hypothetical protein
MVIGRIGEEEGEGEKGKDGGEGEKEKGSRRRWRT